MSEKKDFLSGLVKEDKPDSFKEEERIPVEKKKFPFKPWMIAIPIVLLVVVIFLVRFFFLRANISMPNFVGKAQSEVTTWVRQYGIETSGIAFVEEYSMEYDEDIITSQSIEAGSGVRNNVIVTFGLSLGPDPDEAIEVPDLKNMEKADIDAWVSENKLLNTKVITAYSNTVEENKVIEVDFQNCDEEEFTRGCRLEIRVSRGVAPAGTVTVENFKNKDLATVESWANQNRITLDISEKYSSDVPANQVISQSIEANRTMQQGETLTIAVSKGEGVTVPNFTSMTKSEIKTWTEDNAAVVTLREMYSKSDKYVLEQSVASGEQVGADDKLRLTINLGSYFYLEDEEAPALIGGSYFKFYDWCEDMREKGIDAYIDNYTERTTVYSKEYDAGEIVSVRCFASDGTELDCNTRLPLDVRFDIVVSAGRGVQYTMTECNTVFDLVDFLAKNSIPFNVEANTDFDRRAHLEDEDGHTIDLGDYIFSDQRYIVSDRGGRVPYDCVVDPGTDEPIDSTTTPTE